MTNKNNTIITRRRLLTSAAVGGVLGASQVGAENWVKPVVNSVILPAHAETSDDSGNLGGDVTTAAPLLRFALSEVEGGSQLGLLAPNAQFEAIATRKTTGKLLQDLFIPAARAAIPLSTVTKEYYLGQISGDRYHFVYLQTDTFESKIYFTYLMDGEVSLGVPTSVPYLNCGNQVASKQLELVSVTAGGSALLEIDGASATLYSDQGATPPTPGACQGPVGTP